MGLDLSYTRTGVCVWDGSFPITSKVSSNPDDPYVYRARQIRDGLAPLVARHSPDLFSIEAPLVHARRAEILTGLCFMVLDHLLPLNRPIVLVSNPRLRSLMGIEQTKDKKLSKAVLVAKAQSLLGPSYVKMVHDEADAFLMAYYTRRFWLDWKFPGFGEPLSEAEKDMWYSEELTKKIPKNPRKPRKRPLKIEQIKKKGVVHRLGEFLFLPTKGVE